MKINSKDMRAKILRIVAAHPQAANDDKYLMSLVWMDEGWDNDQFLYSNLKRVSSPETISRTRRKLQEEGLIKPSEKVLEARYKEFKKAQWSIW